jgi:L-2-hydroxyglutarate oxidase LhgO
MLLRVRVTSFLCGFAVAGAAAMAGIRSDVLKSAELVAGEARRSRAELEGRVARLEALLGATTAAASALPPGPAKAEEPSAPSADAIGLAKRVLEEAAQQQQQAAAAAS